MLIKKNRLLQYKRNKLLDKEGKAYYFSLRLLILHIQNLRNPDKKIIFAQRD